MKRLSDAPHLYFKTLTLLCLLFSPNTLPLPRAPAALRLLLQVKDVMAHLYFKAKESFAQQAPKEVGGVVAGNSPTLCAQGACSCVAGRLPRTFSLCLLLAPQLFLCSHPCLLPCGPTAPFRPLPLPRPDFLPAPHPLTPTSPPLAFPQVRILKYLLAVEGEADRDALLAQAFEPGTSPLQPQPAARAWPQRSAHCCWCSLSSNCSCWWLLLPVAVGGCGWLF